MIIKRLDSRKRRKILDWGGHLLSFATVCLVASVMFSVDRSFTEPNETAKFIKLTNLIPIISVSSLILTFVKRNVKFTLTDLLSLLFLVYYLISAFIRGSGNPRQFLLPVALAAVYVVVKVTVSGNDAGLKWIALAILSVSIIELISGIRQAFGYASSNHYQYTITGSFFNPGPFGGYLAFIFVLSLSVLIKMRRKYEIFFNSFLLRKFKDLIRIDVILLTVSFATLILSFILLPATMSRSAWMAVFVVLFMIGIEIGAFKRIRKWLSKRKQLLFPLVLTVTLAVVAIMVGVYSLKKDSAHSRLFSWQISAKVIVGNPVIGVGTGYFGGAYAKQQAKYFTEFPESKYLFVADCPAYAFNEYLQIGTELGLAGLALFVMAVFMALRNIFSKPNPFQYGLIAFLVFAFTSYPFHLVPLLILFVISIATQKNRALPGCLTGKILFAILSVATFAAWIGARQPINDHFKAQTGWQKLKSLYRMDFYDVEGYEKIHAFLNYDIKFLFEYGHVLNKVGEHRKSNEILCQGAALSNDPMFYNVMGNNYLAMKDYERAKNNYEMAYSIVPSRIYPLYLLAKLYSEQGDNSKALNMCRKVMDFKPKVHSPAVSEIKEEIDKLMHKLLNY